METSIASLTLKYVLIVVKIRPIQYGNHTIFFLKITNCFVKIRPIQYGNAVAIVAPNHKNKMS